METVYDGAIHGYNAFIEFPTPHLLRYTNQKEFGSKKYPREDSEGQPLPFPVATSKDSVFNPKNYEHVDKFALEVDASRYDTSVKEFTELLTSDYKSDQMAITRVIFRWLAAQNMDLYATVSTADKESVLWHLHRVKVNNRHYVQMFLDMCRYAGLVGQEVTGYAKHAHLEPGQEPGEESVRSWAAVLINNEWRLVDPHWGSSHMVNVSKGEWVLIDDDDSKTENKRKGPEGTQYAMNEVYFLTNPEQLIYSHLPKDDEKWQLLARPVSMREFVEMAYLKPGFFELDLRLLEQRKCILFANRGQTEINIGIPPGEGRKFMYKLWMSNKQSHSGMELKRFCIMQQKDDVLHTKIYFPTVGKFKFDLFARAVEKDRKATQHSFQIVCSFILHSDQAAEDVKAFPASQAHEWGPGPELQALGLAPITHEDAIIEADNGVVEVSFRSEQPIALSHTLHSNFMKEDQLKKYAVHYMDKEYVNIFIKLPEAGDYALTLFAKPQGEDGPLPFLCNYIVSTAAPASDLRPYPVSGRIGASGHGRSLEMRLISHGSPIILCPSTGILMLVFSTPVPCDVTSRLKLSSESGDIDKSDFIFMEKDDKNITYKIHIPESGLYAFTVFAQRADNEGSLPLAYSVIIDAPLPKQQCAPFPKVKGGWVKGCKLLEPQAGVIPEQTKINIKAEIPTAYEVAAMSGPKWTDLKQEGTLWTGEVESGKPGWPLTLHVKTDAEGREFEQCLAYEVKAVEEIKLEEERQEQIYKAAVEQNKARLDAEDKQKEDLDKEFQEAKEALLKAQDDKDLEALYKAVKTLETKKFVSKVPVEYESAWKMIQSLEKINKLQKAIQELDDSEVQHFKECEPPPDQIHQVFIAALLILGEPEAQTTDWSKCQEILKSTGEDGLLTRLERCIIAHQNAAGIARAQEIIGDFRCDDVSEQNKAAGVLYEWVAGVVTEAHNLGIEPPPPEPQQEKPQQKPAEQQPDKGTGNLFQDYWLFISLLILILAILVLYISRRSQPEAETEIPEGMDNQENRQL